VHHPAKAAPAAVATSPAQWTPPPQAAPVEPVSTKLCYKLRKAWAPYTTAGGQTILAGPGTLLGNRLFRLAEGIPRDEVYQSETPDLKVSLEIWAQEVLTASEGGQIDGHTVRTTAGNIASDCSTLGVDGVFG
jgi:hypothetical protein